MYNLTLYLTEFYKRVSVKSVTLNTVCRKFILKFISKKVFNQYFKINLLHCVLFCIISQLQNRSLHFFSGRVERFNRTVVAYFRTQFVDTRDWPSMLGEFYYKYNNRVNKSTKPMTPYQRFFKRPNFSAVLEEQVTEFKNDQIVRTYCICIFKRYLFKSLYCNSMNRRIKFCWK